MVNRFVYRFQPIARGDAVAFSLPSGVEPNVAQIKRVIGLPGDKLEISGGKILVNGEVLYVAGASAPEYERPLETVPDGMLFILGDNSNNSYGSHRWVICRKST